MHACTPTPHATATHHHAGPCRRPTPTRKHPPPPPHATPQVTGLPVVGATGKVVGVISRKDIIKVRQAGGSLQDKVKAHMTAPALTCTVDMTVKDAGALMLREKIRRLPVVDGEGKPLG
jgi:CBS domain-containing protein